MSFKIHDGQKLLILRYGKQIVDDCIELHQEVIENTGFCWFGKLGTVPAKKSIEAMLSEENPMLILYARNNAFICKVSDVIYDKPINGFPDYYRTELYDKKKFPTVYFKLTSIEVMNVMELNKFIVVSSGNRAINTLMHSMSSFLFVSYGKSLDIEDKVVSMKKSVKKEETVSADCMYRHDGYCGLKGFVNYQYECERPNNCIRQKR
mgnify:FL=1|jgi:hypothetical protein